MSGGMTEMFREQERKKEKKMKRDAKIAKKKIDARRKEIYSEIGLVCVNLFELLREEACL